MRKLILSLALLAGCATDSVTGPLRSWDRGGSDNYRFDFNVSCFCAPEYTQPVTIEVRDDRVARVTSRETGKEVSFTPNGGWPTVDTLFDIVRRARESKEPLEVRYDRELGYPTYIKLGTPENDGGAFYFAGNLRRL